MPTSSPVLARPSPRARTRRADIVVIAVAAVFGVGVLAGAKTLLADPARVDLVIDNPTDYDVNVHVRSAAGGGRLSLGTVSAGSTKSLAGVIDQGERWSFEYSYGGVDAAPVEVPRESIASGEMTVPASAGVEFSDAGLRSAAS